MVRIFNGSVESITSEPHIQTEIPGAVRVMVDESADQSEVVATLLRIANWIEGEAKLAAQGALQNRLKGHGLKSVPLNMEEVQQWLDDGLSREDLLDKLRAKVQETDNLERTYGEPEDPPW